MKLQVVLTDDEGNPIGQGILVESGVVDLSGTMYSEEAIRSIFDQLKTGNIPVVIHASVVE